MGVLEGEGGGGTVLPRLRAQVVVEAGAGRHGLRVEVRREGAVLRNTVDRHVTDTSALHGRTAPRPSQPPSCARKHAPHGHPEGPGAWMGRMTPRAVHSSVHCGEPGVCNSTLPCACARAARRQRMWRNSARHAHHAREQRSATAASSLEFNVDVKDSRAGRRAAQTHAHQERQHGNKLARARPLWLASRVHQARKSSHARCRTRPLACRLPGMLVRGSVTRGTRAEGLVAQSSAPTRLSLSPSVLACKRTKRHTTFFSLR